MNTNDLNTALYEKMAAEQDKFRDWLKSQPPEEILHHTYEYTVREDIVMAMEELELTDAQAKALLESPSPLADVYRYFEKLETGYMDVIRDSIENRADDVCKAQEELRTAPLYPHSAAYASEHGEMAQYNRSYQANSACKEAIAQTISAHYAENRLDTEAAVKDVLEKLSSGRNGYSLFLPTPSSARTMTGVSLRTIKHGQKTFLRWRTAGRSGQSRFDRPVHQTVPKSRSRTAEKFCPAKAQTGVARP